MTKTVSHGSGTFLLTCVSVVRLVNAIPNAERKGPVAKGFSWWGSDSDKPDPRQEKGKTYKGDKKSPKEGKGSGKLGGKSSRGKPSDRGYTER